MIGVEEGREITAVEWFSVSFEERRGDCNKIRYVSMDMSQSCKAATKLCFPEATIVYDHFHVKKLILMGWKRSDERSRKEDRADEEFGRKLLMIPEHRMNEQQREKLMKLSREYPKVGRAYRMVMQLDELYRCHTRPEAESCSDV